MKKKEIFKELQPFLWSYDLSLIDLEDDKQRIIINVINYGKLMDWRRIINYYGRNEIKKIIQETPITEFRPRALKLISFLLNIKDFKYASRSINA